MELWVVSAWLALSVVVLEILQVARKGALQYRGYVGLLAANLALLGWVIGSERVVGATGRPTVELVGALAASALLVLVPALLDRGARWAALGGERMWLAARLASVKELLVPGVASAAEHTWYAQMARAEGGASNDVMKELRQQLIDAEPPDDAVIQERMVTVLVYARRYREAVSQFDAHLARDLIGPVGPGSPGVLRYPGMAIQMVRALGELGEIQRAAELVHKLHYAGRGVVDPALSAVLLQARLYLLAYAGRAAAIDAILALAPLRRMPRRVRARFAEVAREHAGRIPSASEVVAREAPVAPDDRPIDAAAAPVNPLVSEDEDLARYLDHVAEQTLADVRALAQAPSRSFAPATFALVGANLLAYGLFWLLLGEPANADHLLRAGATYDPAVRAGEWWRLWTAMFLHAGPLHLALNLWSLWLLGRVVEPLVGWSRFLLVYAAAGLLGNLASVYHPNAQAVFSLGASGAVLGLVGALLVVLVVRKGRFPEPWRRQTIVNLVVLVGIQLAFGLNVRWVDNFAHLGGFVGGAAVALVVAPGGLLGRGRMTAAVVLVALALLGASALRALVSLAREKPAETLARLVREPERVGRVGLTVLPGTVRVVPAPLPYPDAVTLVESAAALEIEPHLVAIGAAGVGDVLRGLMAHDVAALAEEARQHGGAATVEAAVAPSAGPGSANPTWVGYAQAIPGPDRQLLLYYGRPLDAFGAVVVEMSHRGDLPRGGVVEDEVARLLASVTVAPPAKP